MIKTNKYNLILAMTLMLCLIMSVAFPAIITMADSDKSENPSAYKTGGGYAITNQIQNVGYASELYDSSNGLPTSDANYILGAKNGYVWVGGYSGVFRYNGNESEKMDTSFGLTSARAMYEADDERIWVGTNDNGVVVFDRVDSKHITYKEGLPSSSIRHFEEDNSGNMYVATTAGVCMIDEDYNVHIVDDGRINNAQILKLTKDSAGVVYGQSKSGYIFSMQNGKVTAVYNSSDLGLEKITTILADPGNAGNVYLGTEQGSVYYGKFGDNVAGLQKLNVALPDYIQWLSYDCNRVWVTTVTQVGYIDEQGSYQQVDINPLSGGMEMTTSDYQGNIWVASSTQGVMKLTPNNFENITKKANMPEEVVNTTCLYEGSLYYGTNQGLRVLDANLSPVENELTKYIGDSRVRCINVDVAGNIWVATYTDNKGLVCYSKDGNITSYTKDNGLLHNEVRVVTNASDGSVLVGSNGGLNIIKNGVITASYGKSDVISNTVFLTVCEGANNTIYAGSDGDGIYVIKDGAVTKIGRDQGLSSDVIMRIKKDPVEDIYWLVTSNSLSYMKNGNIKTVESFPNNNNYDIYFDNNNNLWVISSYGIYTMDKKSVIEDNVKDYSLYTIHNGLISTPTSNSYGVCDESGNAYVPGRIGVTKVNIFTFNKMDEVPKVDIYNVVCDGNRLSPNNDGSYTIDSNVNRIQITPAVLDYTLTDPLVKVFLEGNESEGLTSKQSELTSLEYTNLSYGDYKLHIQILDDATGQVLSDSIFKVVKKAKFFEYLAVKILIILILLAIAGLIVWRVMTSTVIRRQYGEISKAKEEAEKANSAKTKFLANMSHEIRTPINTIMGVDEMIIREDAKDVPKKYHTTVTGYANDIKNASELLLSLINDLLDMSKIEAGKMHLVEQEYEPVDMIRSVVSIIRSRAVEKELTFDVDVDEMLPKRMYGDVSKIKQVILNLLTNAVKYTKVGGFTLRILVERIEGDTCVVRISVKDTGIGVKEEDIDKLFTAYERLDEEKNSSIQGTGLGLDISRRFAELMNGTLVCESEYGEGSEFIFTVPQKIVDQRGVGKFVEEDNSNKGPYVPQFIAPDADILIVDDNPMNLSVIKGLLKPTQMFITTVSSGEECLERLKYGNFNVVLLDHMMPGMDGVETMAEIRKTNPNLPVYALTANATLGEEYYISKGFDGYLAKPIDTVAVERAIKKHLPKEIMMTATGEDVVDDLEELPEDMLWINDVDSIDVDEGIKNSGGIEAFTFSLGLFHDTIDENSKVIEDAYNDGDIRLYTVKVHALKTSARIIGDLKLSEMALQLEKAGNDNDTDFIDKNTGALLVSYRGYKEKLSALDKEDDDNKDPVSQDMLDDAYMALEDVIPQMDYDAVEMILGELSEYKLPKEDKAFMDEVETMLKAFDWDGLEAKIKERKKD